MKVAILWTEPSGYLTACLRKLKQLTDAELLFIYQIPSSQAPYTNAIFEGIEHTTCWQTQPTREQIELVIDYQPDLLLFGGWHIGAYRTIAKSLAGKTHRVMAFDNQWRGTLKQMIGQFTSEYFIKKLADFVFVAGERQKLFAKKMGFTSANIIEGVLTADSDLYIAKKAALDTQKFLYVGRLAKEKGLNLLAAAYQEYRNQTKTPWGLQIAGTGPEQSVINMSGVEYLGFIQPVELPNIYTGASCFIMPSSFEAWCVAIHEAACAGLPIICTEECGAATHLVKDLFNGFVVEPGNVKQLAGAMKDISETKDLNILGAASANLSTQYSPTLWVQRLLKKTGHNG